MPDIQKAAQILDWGLIDYSLALQKQLTLVDEVISHEEHPGYIIFCTHPHVVTTGRQTKPEDIFSFTGPVVDVSRGGRATYHGPSQLVIYPILNLKKARQNRGPQEIRGYLRDFEKAIVQTLSEYKIHAVLPQTEMVCFFSSIPLNSNPTATFSNTVSHGKEEYC